MADEARLACVGHLYDLVLEVLWEKWLDTRGHLEDVRDPCSLELVVIRCAL